MHARYGSKRSKATRRPLGTSVNLVSTVSASKQSVPSRMSRSCLTVAGTVSPCNGLLAPPIFEFTQVAVEPGAFGHALAVIYTGKALSQFDLRGFRFIGPYEAGSKPSDL